MTELPAAFVKNTGMGLQARGFKKAAQQGQDQDNSWTETPEQKRKRLAARSQLQPTARPVAAVSTRDAQLAAQVAKYNDDHRPASLVELHQAKRKKAIAAGGTEIAGESHEKYRARAHPRAHPRAHTLPPACLPHAASCQYFPTTHTHTTTTTTTTTTTKTKTTTPAHKRTNAHAYAQGARVVTSAAVAFVRALV